MRTLTEAEYHEAQAKLVANIEELSGEINDLRATQNSLDYDLDYDEGCDIEEEIDDLEDERTDTEEALETLRAAWRLQNGS